MTDYERGYEQGKADALKAQEHTSFMDSKLNPIKRPWVGLTDEDRRELAAEQHSWEGLCSAVETKLKEKNT